jgi:hypothetical protein
MPFSYDDSAVYGQQYSLAIASQVYIQDFFFAVALQPNAGHGLLILEVSRLHTTTHHSR